MFPILGSFTARGRVIEIETYHLLLLAGLAAGILLAARQLRRAGASGRGAAAIVAWAIAGGVLGARALYVVVNLDQYYFACLDPAYFNATWRPDVPLGEPACWEALKSWRGGMVYYGAFLGGAG